jgi:hypothetical protein
MEDDAKAFLLRIVRSITVGLLWLLINMTFGLYLGWLVFEGAPTLGNFIFYAWLIISFALMILYFIRTWRGHLHNDEQQTKNNTQ